MAEQEYFKSALSDFVYDVASAGAIRHLADLGYTARQIMKNLTYPTPYERVQKTVWKHLTDSGVVLTKEPGSGRQSSDGGYTAAHDKYGRAGFQLEPVGWKELHYSEDKCGSLEVYLKKQCDVNGDDAYISCDFGMHDVRASAEYEEAMRILNERQREYIEGLLWEDRICYHRLNQRMREIMVILYESGLYRGNCYFLKTGEKVII